MPLLFRTDRLAIRPFSALDAADVFAVYGDPHVLRIWNSGPLADLEEGCVWAAGQGAAHASRGYSQWHVSERDGGRFVGCLGLQPLGDEVELLFALAPDVWGRGYATEAARAALLRGFAGLRLRRIACRRRRARVPNAERVRREGGGALPPGRPGRRSGARRARL